MFGTKRVGSITIVSAAATTSIFFNWFQVAVDQEVPKKASQRFDHFHNFVQILNSKRTAYLYLQSEQYLIRSICRVTSSEARADEEKEASSLQQINLSDSTSKTESNAIESNNEDDRVQSINSLEESVDEDDEKVWSQKAENCGFCRYFLTSPCAQPFKAWSLCVDKAKADNADFVSQCAERTAALMECTSSHSAYFNQPNSSEESESESVDAEDPIAEGGGAEAVKPSSGSSATSESVSIEPEGEAKEE